jgi:hypothetical protein
MEVCYAGNGIEMHGAKQEMLLTVGLKENNCFYKYPVS